MLTKKLNECVQHAMEDNNVNKLITQREKHKNITIKTIQSTIIKRNNQPNYFAMIVRIAFDFKERQGGNISEDILVDVVYKKNHKTNQETFTVKKPLYVPEVLDLDS